MEKRKLSKVPVETADNDMLDIAKRLNEKYIVKVSLIDDNKILLMNFYEIETLRTGNTKAAFRTFMSKNDYITQDLTTSKIKWKTASFSGSSDWTLYDVRWNKEKGGLEYINRAFIHSTHEQQLIEKFFYGYGTNSKIPEPWNRVSAFQEKVLKERLMAKHKKETAPIDEKMAVIKEPPKEFLDWVWETGMSFSRYLIYKDVGKGMAECECTYCKKKGNVDRNKIRLRNNEKGECPFCGSKVTIKAKGRLPAQIYDERWFMYVDKRKYGFILRYFHAIRKLRNEKYIENTIDKKSITEFIGEYRRAFYTFPDRKIECDSYEWADYKQTGKVRWCHDEGKQSGMHCILYPDNLPQAWEHTPMKYSGLEYLSRKAPTISCRYADAIKGYIKYPKLEWICKMGLSNLAFHLIQFECKGYGSSVGKVKLNADTIYKILGLNKVNTRILQEVNGGDYQLRLLQVAQQIGLNFKPDQLKEYYDTFECNTELLQQANRKVSLHKIVKYISKESERYPLGDKKCQWGYAFQRYTEREDPRIERKRNLAKDWLEYLDWCKALNYDLDNMFIYMPKNFKKVHDRTAKEYQALQDKKAAEEMKKREAAAKKAMEQTQKAIKEIFEKNESTDAFSIKGKGLILVVPKSGDEIRAEGEALHHCVGGYVSKVAKGETNIFFIRKSDKPNEPYFTMEWKNNTVVQCRGAHNCSMPPEVKAFVNVFEKTMLEAIERNSKTNKAERKVG